MWSKYDLNYGCDLVAIHWVLCNEYVLLENIQVLSFDITLVIFVIMILCLKYN